MLEDHIGNTRGKEVFCLNFKLPALTAKAKCNSGSSNCADSNNTDNESLKPDFQLKLLIKMFVKVMTMSTKQITKKKPQKDT